MRLIEAVVVVTLLAVSLQNGVRAGPERRVVCYYTNWSVYRPGTAKFNPQNINPYLCTHLIYAFGGLDRENGLRPYDKYQDIEQGGYAKFTGLKTYNKELKTLLAIGGWNEGSARFSPLVADEERRREFVRNVIKFLRQNHFDGLDLDWEYPAYRDGGKPRDRDNYAQLVQELREEFERESSKTGRPRLLLTMAVPAGIEYIDKGYDIPKLNRYLDFMNILSYDYHSAFEPSVNHHSPLYSIEEESEYNFDSKLTIDGTVKHYLMKGADPEKLVLGIPTYGRSYTLFNPDSTDLGSPADGPGEQGEATREKGYLAYYEICSNIENGWTVVQPKESAMGPYAFKDNQWVGYDDEAIVKKKAQYVNERNLGGIMFWSIDNDDFRGKCHARAYPLIEAAKEALLGKGGVSSNKLPSGTRGGKTGKTAVSKPRTTTPQPPRTTTVTTPEPPTTPDPGSDFVCKDEGFFPHPRDCKKYFWCLDSGPSDLGIVAHQFTCPSGLYFNKAADSCDFSRNVICKKPKATSTTTTTTTSAPKTSKLTPGKITLPPKTTTYTTTTTTTTTPEPELEEEDEDYKEEDPQTIKQLINLIKKLGGVAELEKQLEGNSGIDSTTPAISKSLYQRVINSGSPRYQTIQRNGPSGPQNEGLNRERSSSSFRRDKPQYVTIKRERPSTTTEEAEIVYAVEEAPQDVVLEEEEEEVTRGTPKYQSILRNRGSERPKYQPAERFRGRTEATSVPSTTLKYTSILRSRAPTEATATTSKYVVLQRQRTTSNYRPEDVGTTENELNDEEEVTEHIIETTTSRPRVKVSELVPTTESVPTSTRVVTEIVEGATQRQRVPISQLRRLIKQKESENSIVGPAKEEEKPTTEEAKTERPLLHGFHRRRPEIVVTSTARTTPAFLARRRSTRPPIITTPDNHEQFNISSTTESISSTTQRDRFAYRNRFSVRRKTTEKPEGKRDEGDEVFVQGNTRDSNVIRKPVYKPRFPSRRRPTTETPTEVPSSSTEGINSPLRRHTTTPDTPTELPSSTSEESVFPVERLPDTPEPQTEFLSSTEGRISPLRRRPTTPETQTDQSSSTEIISPVVRRRTTTSEPQTSSTKSNTSPSVKFNTSTTENPPTTTFTILDGEVLKPIKHIYTSEEILFATDQSLTTIIPSIIEIDGANTSEIQQGDLLGVRIRGEPGISNTPDAFGLANTTENLNKIEGTDKFIKLPLVSPTEINGMATLEERSPTPISIIDVETTPKYISRFNQLSYTESDTTKLTSRFNHGRNFINSSSNSSSLQNNIKEIVETNGRKKIILRRRKPTTESNLISEVTENVNRVNRTAVIKRKRPIIQEKSKDSFKESNKAATSQPTKIQRGRVKFNTYKNDDVNYEDNIASSSRGTSRSRILISSKATNRPDEVSENKTNQIKHKRIIIRGKKKFTDESDIISQQKVQRPNNFYIENNQEENNINSTESTPKHRNKFRKVLLRKTVKDLAVEESMSPGKNIGNSNTRLSSSRGESDTFSKEDLDIDFTEDIIHTRNREQEIQTRTRRPFRKTVVRSTTTSTTETPTTTRPRTTVHSLRQRLNRFKIERNFPKASTAVPIEREEPQDFPEEGPTTVRPTRKEFRRLIRPLPVEDSEVDASQDESKSSSPQNEIRSGDEEEPLVLPDLANVAVAAIQSLATSSPPTSTTPNYRLTVTEKYEKFTRVPEGEKYEKFSRAPESQKYEKFNRAPEPEKYEKFNRAPEPEKYEKFNRAPVTEKYEKISRTPVVRKRPHTSRPTHAPPTRSSPRPFSKLNYDDYEDYYAEPVEVPLSGKVRIHNDGYIECLDIGNFPHPFSCRKFISCAKMENSHLLGWEYTCPKGLSFDPIGGICNWNAGLGCKE